MIAHLPKDFPEELIERYGDPIDQIHPLRSVPLFIALFNALTLLLLGGIYFYFKVTNPEAFYSHLISGFDTLAMMRIGFVLLIAFTLISLLFSFSASVKSKAYLFEQGLLIHNYRSKSFQLTLRRNTTEDFYTFMHWENITEIKYQLSELTLINRFGVSESMLLIKPDDARRIREHYSGWVAFRNETDLNDDELDIPGLDQYTCHDLWSLMKSGYLEHASIKSIAGVTQYHFDQEHTLAHVKVHQNFLYILVAFAILGLSIGMDYLFSTVYLITLGSISLLICSVFMMMLVKRFILNQPLHSLHRHWYLLKEGLCMLNKEDSQSSLFCPLANIKSIHRPIPRMLGLKTMEGERYFIYPVHDVAIDEFTRVLKSHAPSISIHQKTGSSETFR